MPAIALEAFGGLIGHWIWLSLIHSLWIGLLAAAAAALITQSAPRLTPGPPRDPGRRDARRGPGACRDDRLARPRARAGGQSGRAGCRPRVPRSDWPGIARRVGPGGRLRGR